MDFMGDARDSFNESLDGIPFLPRSGCLATGGEAGAFRRTNIAFLIAVLASTRGMGAIKLFLRDWQQKYSPLCGEYDCDDNALAFNTIRALVYAVCSDGTLGNLEKQSIECELQALGVPQEAKQFVGQCLSEEIVPDRIAQNITFPEKDAEAFWLYTFSFSATPCTLISPMKREYLDRLAASLRIPKTTKWDIEQQCSLRRKKKQDLN